jgi:hypothetical protein
VEPQQSDRGASGENGETEQSNLHGERPPWPKWSINAV